MQEHNVPALVAVARDQQYFLGGQIGPGVGGQQGLLKNVVPDETQQYSLAAGIGTICGFGWHTIVVQYSFGSTIIRWVQTTLGSGTVRR